MDDLNSLFGPAPPAQPAQPAKPAQPRPHLLRATHHNLLQHNTRVKHHCNITEEELTCGAGEPSLERDSGVIMPDTETWLGLLGAERLLARYGVRKQGTPRCRRRRNAWTPTSQHWRNREGFSIVLEKH